MIGIDCVNVLRQSTGQVRKTYERLRRIRARPVIDKMTAGRKNGRDSREGRFFSAVFFCAYFGGYGNFSGIIRTYMVQYYCANYQGTGGRFAGIFRLGRMVCQMKSEIDKGAVGYYG